MPRPTKKNDLVRVALLLPPDLKAKLKYEGKQIGLELNPYVRMILETRKQGAIATLLETARLSRTGKR